MPNRQLDIRSEGSLWPLTWPMGLTMLRLALLPVFLYILLSDVGTGGHDNRRWAVAIFAVMAATDKLDGYLARKLNQTSKLGAMLDPLADKLLIACSIILLSFSFIATPQYRIPRELVIIIYGKDLLVAFGVLALLSRVGTVTISPRPLGKLGTFLQLSLVIATLLAPDIARFREALAVGLTRTLWWSTGLVTVASAVDYVVLGARQLAASRTRQQQVGPTVEAKET